MWIKRNEIKRFGEHTNKKSIKIYSSTHTKFMHFKYRAPEDKRVIKNCCFKIAFGSTYQWRPI